METVRVARPYADTESFTLVNDSGDAVSILLIRYLPGRRMWPQWRENYARACLAPGAHTRLQEAVVRMRPGFSMVSAPHEMSDAAVIFRHRYMRNHPELDWTYDRTLDSDGSECTPHMERQEVDAMLASV